MKCPLEGETLVADNVEAHTGYGCPSCKSAWLPKKYINSIKYTHHFDPITFWNKLAEQKLADSDLDCPHGCGKLAEANPLVGMLYCGGCSGVLFRPNVLKHWLKQYQVKEDPIALDKVLLGISLFDLI